MCRKPFIAGLFVLVFLIGLVSESGAQTEKSPKQPTAVVVAVENNRPADEAKIKGVIPDYEIKEITLEYLQTLPMPEIQFVFETQNNQKQTLTDEAGEILNSHWKEAIKFFYNEQFNKPSNAPAAYERDMAWSKYCFKTQRELQKLFIEAPKGKRKISQTEASELYAFVNRAAVEVVKEVKNIKNYAIVLRSND